MSAIIIARSNPKTTSRRIATAVILGALAAALFAPGEASAQAPSQSRKSRPPRTRTGDRLPGFCRRLPDRQQLLQLRQRGRARAQATRDSSRRVPGLAHQHRCPIVRSHGRTAHQRRHLRWSNRFPEGDLRARQRGQVGIEPVSMRSSIAEPARWVGWDGNYGLTVTTASSSRLALKSACCTSRRTWAINIRSGPVTSGQLHSRGAEPRASSPLRWRS